MFDFPSCNPVTADIAMLEWVWQSPIGKVAIVVLAIAALWVCWKLAVER